VPDDSGATKQVTHERRLRFDPLAALRADIVGHIRRQAP
jgi:hypothetical protein